MNADKRWIPVLAMTLSAALLAAMATTLRRRNVRAAHVEQHKTTLKAWENEGGNLAPSQISYTRVTPDTTPSHFLNACANAPTSVRAARKFQG